MNTDILISMLIRRYSKTLGLSGDHTALFSLVAACTGISDPKLRKNSLDLCINALYSAFANRGDGN